MMFRRPNAIQFLVPVVLAASLLSTPGPAAAEGAIDERTVQRAARRVLEHRAGQVSPLARAALALRRSLETSRGLALEAQEQLGQGTLSHESVALRTLALEAHNLRTAHDALRLAAASRPTPAGASAERGSPGRELDRELHRALERVDLLIRLLSELRPEWDRADRPSLGRRVGEILNETEALLASIRYESRALTATVDERPGSTSIDLTELTDAVDRRISTDAPGRVRKPKSVGMPEGSASSRRGDANGHGKGISAPIAALAAALDHDPVAIYEHVRDNFRFELYFGYLKGAQATLETGGGNDFDLAALTRELLVASGFEVRYVRGAVRLSAAAVVEWLGLESATAAGPILSGAGFTVSAVFDGGPLDYYTVNRIWLEVAQSPRPGAEPDWLPLDPAFKRHDLSPGLPGILAAVPFDESTFLAEPRIELPHEFFASQVRDYLQANLPGAGLGDVPLGKIVRPEHAGGLPRSLPYPVETVSVRMDTIPVPATHAARVLLLYGPYIVLDHEMLLPESSLQRMTISYAVYPEDQPIVDGYGGLVNTPPGAAYVIPQLKLDGVLVNQIVAIPYLAPVRLEVTLDAPDSFADRTVAHNVLAGQWVALGLEATQTSDALLQRQVRAFTDAVAILDAGGTPDPDDLIGALLYYAVMSYHRDFQEAREDTSALAHFAPLRFVNEAIVFGDQQVLSVGGVPFTTIPGGLLLDVRSSRAELPLNDDASLGPQLRRLLGFSSSAEEHALWEGLLDLPAMSTIKSLQIANASGIPVFVIDNFDADADNDCADLCPLLNLPEDIEDLIDVLTQVGFTVTTPRDKTPLNDWDGVGFIADQEGGSAAYIISGRIILESEDTPAGTPTAAGGAVTVVIEDGTILSFPAGELGNAPGQVFAGDPVNIANGNFYRDELDFSIPALGEPLAFQRSYNSRSTYDGPLGIGWTHHYGDFLARQDDGSVVWVDGTGSAYVFTWERGTFAAPPGLRETLIEDVDGFTLRRFDGRTQRFDPDGRLLWRADRNGNPFTFGYDANERLVTVTDPAARTLTFGYNSSNRIETVLDFSRRTWQYSYDVEDRLTQVVSASDAATPARVTEYAYDGEDRLARITEPSGGVRELRYYADGRTAEVLDPLGGVMSLTYNPFKQETVVTNERGLRSIYGFNDHGNLVALTHPDGTRETWTYVDNRITSHTDALGHTTTYEYSEGNLTRVVDPTNVETRYEYEPPYSNLTRVLRPGDRVSQLDYDAAHNLSLFVDGAGGRWNVVHDGRGLPQSVTDARGAVTTYAFDEAGLWTLRTTELPSTESRGYNPRGALREIVDGNDHPFTIAYDLLDRPIRQMNAEGNVTRFVYDAAGRLTQVIDPRDFATTLEYDEKDRLVRRVAPDGSDTRFEYDAVGNLVRQIDELGRVTRVAYDDRDRPVALTRPDGAVTRVRYDAAGRVVALTDARDNTTTFEYDDAGRLRTSVDPLEGRSEWTYDANGNAATILDRRGGLTLFKYDALNRVVEVRAPEGQITTADYDPNGNLETIVRYDVQGLGEIPEDPRTLPAERKRIQTHVFDVLNRLERILDPEGHAQSFGYDPAGNVTSFTDERLEITTAEFDAADRLTGILRPDQAEVTISYDASGNQSLLQTATGGRYAWSYDARNRVTAARDPNGRPTTFDYDVAGNLVRQRNPDGGWVAYAYDPLDRLKLLRRSDGTYTSRGYDPAGNVIRAQTERTQLHLIYDALNRLTSETLSFQPDGFTKTVEYDYNAGGDLTRVTDPEGRTIDYARDLAGRLTGVTDLAGPTVGVAYNGFSERSRLAYGNGTVGDFSYDKTGLPSAIDWTDAIASLEYLRDAAGNPTTIEETIEGVSEMLSLAYDDLGRPLSVTATSSPETRSESFDFDPNDNPVDPGDATTSIFDLADQLVAGAVGDVEHDAQGNRVAVDHAMTRVETPHDPSGRITRVRRIVDRFVDHDVLLTHDGLGRLVEIRSGDVVRRIVHAYGNRLREYDGSGATTIAYTSSGQLDDVFATTVGGTLHYLHRDAVNSVRASTGPDGAVTGSQHYGLFGRPQASPGLGDVPLGYTGRPFDAATGLVDLRARFYDPQTATFLSRDPIGLLPGIPNLYAYAANRPQLFNDPLGLLPQEPIPRMNHSSRPQEYVLTDDITPLEVIPRRETAGQKLQGFLGGFVKGAGVGVAFGILAVACPVCAGGVAVVGLIHEIATGFEGTRTTAGAISRAVAGEGSAEDFEIAGGFLGGIVGGVGGVEGSIARGAATRQVARGAGKATTAPRALLAPVKLQRHHIFPKKFRDFFRARGIDIDNFTVEISQARHLRSVHGRGDATTPGRFNQRWAEFIEANPNATAREIYQFGGRLMEEYGLSNLPIVPYR